MGFSVAAPMVPYSALGMDVQGSAIDASMSVLAAATHPIISLAMGSPGADAIPRAAIAEILRTLLDGDRGWRALDYSPTEGDPHLRSALMARLSTGGGEVDPDCLLVTAGGMQGLDLAAKLFVGRGDLVVAESPSYPNGLATFHNYGARIIQVPLDERGMDLQAARDLVREADSRPRVIYAIPTFQNPSGVTYDLERRQGLLELAREWGALVIEDDPYSELRYDGEDVPSLLSLDGSAGTVIQVRTFSKIVAPGLRVGWVVAPVDAIRRMVSARQSMDTCANTLSQRVIARLITSGQLEAHIAGLRALYPRRRDAVLEALDEEFAGSGVSWSRPSGGMFVWVTLRSPVKGIQLMSSCLDAGVAVVPGDAFDPIRGGNALRLCFSAPAIEDIREGITRLGAAIRALGDSR